MPLGRKAIAHQQIAGRDQGGCIDHTYATARATSTPTTGSTTPTTSIVRTGVVNTVTGGSTCVVVACVIFRIVTAVGTTMRYHVFQRLC